MALDRDGRIAFLNPEGAVLLGDSAVWLLGRTLGEVLPDARGAELEAGLAPLARGKRSVVFEVRHPRTDGWLAVRGWAKGHLISLTVRDVSERREAEEELAHRALHDPLTGLANRVLLLERLQLVAARRPEALRPAAVLFVDLDRFKPINDDLGHDAGDVVLQEVSRRLTALVRPTDTVARLGGGRVRAAVRGPGGR